MAKEEYKNFNNINIENKYKLKNITMICSRML